MTRIFSKTPALSLAVLMLCALTFSQCTKRFICIKDNGSLITKTIQPGFFDAVEISIGAEVVYEYAESHYLIYEGPDNYYEVLDIAAGGNILKVETDRCFKNTDNIKLTIGAPYIQSVSLNGSGSFIGQSVLGNTEKLSIKLNGSADFFGLTHSAEVISDINGSGDIQLTGTSNHAELRINGSGKYRAFDLETNTANVRINGSGSAYVWVHDALDVNISGSGSVHYKGSPLINSNITGSGKLVNAN